jgi:hypothetical protein
MTKIPINETKIKNPAAELRGIKIQNLFPCCHSCPGFPRDKLQQESRVSREGGNPVTFCSSLLEPALECPCRGQGQVWIPTFVGMTDEVNL